MPYTPSEVIVLFFTYSVVGWLWETIYCSIKDHQYAYRGFLFGPYCPVYGFAITTILITTYQVRDNLFLLFICGITRTCGATCKGGLHPKSPSSGELASSCWFVLSSPSSNG